MQQLQNEKRTSEGKLRRSLSRQDSIREDEGESSQEERESLERRRLLLIEAELQNALRKKAIPVITRKLACEDINMEQVQREEKEKLQEQRHLLRKQTMQSAQAESKWVIFGNTDLFDDFEIEELSNFMEKLLNKVPSVFWAEQQSVQSATELDRINVSRENSSDSILGNIAFKRENSANKLLRLERIKMNSEPSRQLDGDIKDFVLPSGLITPKVVGDIIELYRRDGKLNIKAVQKLLRLAYRNLKILPNITKIRLDKGQNLTVVGDIHGQLADLLHIIDEVGFPSETNFYIFNGDFVDRGPQGVEVMCILLAMYCAFPKFVTLNRGNHEDFAICCAYGFQRECCDKYDDLVFGMFCELFRYLPLFALVNDVVFILHGGLFHAEASLSDLNDINRSEFNLRDSQATEAPITGTVYGCARLTFAE